MDRTAGDITGGTVGDWLATGWFTPDYRPLARKLAATLAEHGAPFHLWERPKLTKDWSTLQKPSVVLATMAAYPGKTIVLMDVDCLVRGDIEPVTGIGGDVGVSVKMQQDPRSLKRVTVMVGSRVVVFRPTEGARDFVQEWDRLCGRAKTGGDEAHMVWAYLSRPDIAYTLLDPRYTGREVTAGGLHDAVIVHDGAHEKAEARASVMGAVKQTFKAIERRFKVRRKPLGKTASAPPRPIEP